MKKDGIAKTRNVVFYEIADFEYYLRDNLRLSDNTINAYIVDLYQYEEFMQKYEKIEDVRDISKDDIDKYIQSLKRKNLSKPSISRKIIAIKDFHKFLYKENITKDNKAANLETPKPDQKLPEVLSKEEIIKMIDSIDGKEPLDERNRAMMELLYSSGLRISELISLTLDMIHLRQQYLVVKGKGDKERMVPIGDYAKQALEKYLGNGREKILNGKRTNLLFFNYKGEMMSRQAFFKYIKKLAKDNGIEKNISPHTIRHSFATHLLENGTDLIIIQALLGHEDISTTQIYTHIDRSKLIQEYDRTHPIVEMMKNLNKKETK